MFESVGRSFELLKRSWGVLMRDPELLVFPVLSGIASLGILITFFLPFLVEGFAKAVESDVMFYAYLFLYYYASYFVVIFFNTALVGAASVRLNGGDPNIGDGFKAAFSNILQIAIWALIASSVGLVLNALERQARERNNWVGSVASSLLGAAWTIATYFVVPVMIFEKRDAFSALGRSVELMKKSWGENLVGNFSLGIFYFLALLGGILLIVAGIVAVPQLFPVLLVLGIGFFVLLAVVFNALDLIYQTALYYYASTGKSPAQFAGIAEQAFTQQK